MTGVETFKGPGGRWYQLTVQCDLIGDFHVTRHWRGERSGRGGSKTVLVHTDEECEKLVRHIRNRRRAHGYVSVGPCPKSTSN